VLLIEADVADLLVPVELRGFLDAIEVAKSTTAAARA
jgi:hypothetical protein